MCLGPIGFSLSLIQLAVSRRHLLLIRHISLIQFNYKYKVIRRAKVF